MRLETDDFIRGRGEVLWRLKDPDGRILLSGGSRNKTNNNALSAIVQWGTGTANIGIGAVSAPTQMQLGTGTGTPSSTDTGLFTPTSGTVQPITNASPYQTFYMQFLAYWGSSTPAGNYTEAGLFDTNMTLWAHVLLQTSAGQPYIPISAGQTLTILWKLQLIGN